MSFAAVTSRLWQTWTSFFRIWSYGNTEYQKQREKCIHCLGVLSSEKENKVKSVIMLLYVYSASWTWCEVLVPSSKWVWKDGECCNRATRLHREAVETPLLEVLKWQLKPNTKGDCLEQDFGLKDIEKSPATWFILWWKIRDSICMRTKELTLVSSTLENLGNIVF